MVDKALRAELLFANSPGEEATIIGLFLEVNQVCACKGSWSKDHSRTTHHDEIDFTRRARPVRSFVEVRNRTNWPPTGCQLAVGLLKQIHDVGTNVTGDKVFQGCCFTQTFWT